MKIFVSHTNQIDYQNELYTPLRESALNQTHSFFLPHEGNKNVNTKHEIQASDLVLAEVSFPATGSGIEIGWADAVNVPLLCVYKEGMKISGSLKFITNDFIEYSSPEDLITKLTDYLQTKKF
jgi:hypothetical protein